MEPSRHDRDYRRRHGRGRLRPPGPPTPCSPVLHSAWIAAAGLNAAYVPFAPSRGRFRAPSSTACAAARSGASTSPCRSRIEALAVADAISDLRQAWPGAANLLIFETDGTIFADNTDGPGMLGGHPPSRRRASTSPPAPVVILGAGGAARGRGRRPGPGRRARTSASSTAPSTRPEAIAVHRPWSAASEDELDRRCWRDAGLVINATSPGPGRRRGPGRVGWS